MTDLETMPFSKWCRFIGPSFGFLNRPLERKCPVAPPGRVERRGRSRGRGVKKPGRRAWISTPPAPTLYTPANARRMPCQWNASRARWPRRICDAMHARCRATCSNRFICFPFGLIANAATRAGWQHWQGGRFALPPCLAVSGIRLPPLAPSLRQWA